MTDQNHITSPRRQAVAIAIDCMGGVPVRPTAEALQLAGLPRRSKSAISQMRRHGELPVTEVQIAGRYYVTAAAFAAAFLEDTEFAIDPTDAVAAVPALPRRRPGRPRKGQEAQS